MPLGVYDYPESCQHSALPASWILKPLKANWFTTSTRVTDQSWGPIKRLGKAPLFLAIYHDLRHLDRREGQNKRMRRSGIKIFLSIQTRGQHVFRIPEIEGNHHTTYYMEACNYNLKRPVLAFLSTCLGQRTGHAWVPLKNKARINL